MMQGSSILKSPIDYPITGSCREAQQSVPHFFTIAQRKKKRCLPASKCLGVGWNRGNPYSFPGVGQTPENCDRTCLFESKPAAPNRHMYRGVWRQMIGSSVHVYLFIPPKQLPLDGVIKASLLSLVPAQSKLVPAGAIINANFVLLHIRCIGFYQSITPFGF